MDNQNDDKLENHEWIRRVKFVKRNRKMTQKSTKLDKEEISVSYPDGNDGNIHTPIHRKNKPRPKRLLFKNKKKIEVPVATEKVENIPLKQDIPHWFSNQNDTNKGPSKRPLKIYEYGCDGNGYKFIAFDEGSIPGQNTEKEDYFTDSSNEQSSYTSEEETALYEFNELYNYKVYNLKWKEIIKQGVIHNLFLPVYSNSFNDVNKQSVMIFLKTKKNLRYERLKWHPDKMKPLLSKNNLWDDHSESIVTHVFQVINDLYQNT